MFQQDVQSCEENIGIGSLLHGAANGGQSRQKRKELSAEI